ncbi:MAG: hypothetical protein K6U02_05620 [Firmicutes bacterium]|nr:hypothetical protein [Bacillota bacterium]
MPKSRFVLTGSLLVGWVFIAPAVAAQTVLFDGTSLEQRRAAALLVPADVTGDDYALFARLEYGLTGYFNFFGQSGGRFDGGGTLLPGLGWSATLYEQSDRLPLNLGLFNSFLFPIEDGLDPDAFITIAPVLSHRFGPADTVHTTVYGGATSTFIVGPGGADVNALFGVKVAGLGREQSRWDFLAEVQAGESSRFALGFRYRF